MWVSTPALMRGYLDRDDLTAKVVADGWFATGDIGTLDEHGRLYLRGREREEINKGGLKVYPADIDTVVESFPATVDVCAFAFEDSLLGEDVGVAVVLRDEAPDTMSELHAWTVAAPRETPGPAPLVRPAGDPAHLPRQGQSCDGREPVRKRDVAERLGPARDERMTQQALRDELLAAVAEWDQSGGNGLADDTPLISSGRLDSSICSGSCSGSRRSSDNPSTRPGSILPQSGTRSIRSLRSSHATERRTDGDAELRGRRIDVRRPEAGRNP